MKKNLTQTNPYIKDPADRLRILTSNAYESSVFEVAKLGKSFIQESALEPQIKLSLKKRADKSLGNGT